MSIVFREKFVDNKRQLEVAAVLSGRYEQNTRKKSTDTEPEQACPLIACTSFHKALTHFQNQHDLYIPIESIDLFNH